MVSWHPRITNKLTIQCGIIFILPSCHFFSLYIIAMTLIRLFQNLAMMAILNDLTLFVALHSHWCTICSWKMNFKIRMINDSNLNKKLLDPTSESYKDNEPAEIFTHLPVSHSQPDNIYCVCHHITAITNITYNYGKDTN